MILEDRQIKIVKEAIKDYDFIKAELDNKISKDYDLDDLAVFITKFADTEITNLEKYEDIEYLDFIYKDLNMCVMNKKINYKETGISVSPTFEIYDKEKYEYIVEDFCSKKEYKDMITATRLKQLKDMVADVKRYCEIAFHDSDVNDEYPIGEGDLEHIYNIVKDFKEEDYE